MAYAIEHPHRNQVAVASGLDALAGVWLFISAFALEMNPALEWSCGIVGIIVLVLAAIRAFGAYGQAWMSWVNAVLGLWVIFSPWLVADVQTDQGIWNAVITGIIMVILASWSAIATQTERREPATVRTSTTTTPPRT